MPHPPRIREFRPPVDCAAARDLQNGLRKGVRLGPSDEPADLEKKTERDLGLFLVVEAEREMIGSVIGGYDGRRGPFRPLAVFAPFRGQGVGSRLRNGVEGRLRARGCNKCYLLATLDNPQAKEYSNPRARRPMEPVRLEGRELA